MSDWCGAAICAAVAATLCLGVWGLVAGPGAVLVLWGLTYWPERKR